MDAYISILAIGAGFLGLRLAARVAPRARGLVVSDRCQSSRTDHARCRATGEFPTVCATPRVHGFEDAHGTGRRPSRVDQASRGATTTLARPGGADVPSLFCVDDAASSLAPSRTHPQDAEGAIRKVAGSRTWTISKLAWRACSAAGRPPTYFAPGGPRIGSTPGNSVDGSETGDLFGLARPVSVETGPRRTIGGCGAHATSRAAR